jgi:hypothetical protein
MKTMKIKFIFALFIVSMVFSCKAQKKSNSSGQDNSAAKNMKTSETYFNDEQQRIEDIGIILKDWTRSKEYPFRNDSIPKIIYGNGRFLATGNEISLAYSDDGDTWYEVKSDVIKGADLVMAFGKGRFVAASSGNEIAFSNDGITWERAKNGGIGDYFIYDMAYGNGCFVAVGFDRTAYGYGIIGYSYDGETWTLAENDLNIGRFCCIVYGNGMFIAGTDEGEAAFSSDGKTWEVIPGSPFDDMSVYIIAYGNERFVAYSVFVYGAPVTFYSDNGIDWRVASTSHVEPVQNIVYGNGIFIAGSGSARMSYSIDGDIWYPKNEEGFTINALADPKSYIGGIAYGNGRFVIGSFNYAKENSNSWIVWCDMPDINNTTLSDNLLEDDKGNEVNK